MKSASVIFPYLASQVQNVSIVSIASRKRYEWSNDEFPDYLLWLISAPPRRGAC
jgi:hypothetical protein